MNVTPKRKEAKQHTEVQKLMRGGNKELIDDSHITLKCNDRTAQKGKPQGDGIIICNEQMPGGD